MKPAGYHQLTEAEQPLLFDLMCRLGPVVRLPAVRGTFTCKLCLLTCVIVSFAVAFAHT